MNEEDLLLPELFAGKQSDGHGYEVRLENSGEILGVLQ